MTLKGKRKVCGMREKSRMKLGCGTMTLKSKGKVCEMQKRAEWSWDA